VGKGILKLSQLQANHERVSSFPTSQASVRPSHPNIAGTTREVGSRAHCGFKEWPVRVKQGLVSDDHFHRPLQPRRVPHSKKPWPAPHIRKGGVTFHQPLVECPGFAFVGIPRIKVAVISEAATTRINYPACQRPTFPRMFVFELPELVWQPKKAGTKYYTQAI